jgi:beta-1,4-mannosyl-glycoprotein beta-1,4-N-acetylglucosaminyltransferase
MKIYDCFMYYDEDLLLDLRLNYLSQYVDFFVICESSFTHRGERKKLNFELNKFKEFKNKIIYLNLDHQPLNIKNINVEDSEEEKENKNIFNGYAHDIFQRQYLELGLKNTDDDDIIFISDIDEIPKLENFDFSKIGNNIICFKQKLFYYKFNLLYKNFDWFGTKCCKKKIFKSPQWLREIKSKKYSPFRIDILFSKKKYSNITHVDDGGWHFSYIKSPDKLFEKLKNFAHYYEFEQSGIDFDQLKKLIDERRIIYNHGVDQRSNKWNSDIRLEKINLDYLPKNITENINKYSKFIA